MDELRQRAEVAESRLAEAKAETEKWRKSAQVYRARYILALNDRDVAQAELEIKNDDAEIGRLVRKMRKHTALIKTESTYWGQTGELSTTTKWTTADHPWVRDDPAEALRAIQEGGDAEA